MIVYSYVTPKAYGVLLSSGKLSAKYEDIDKDFVDAYNWMREQMTIKIGPPPNETTYPIWLWHTWEDTEQYMPVEYMKNARIYYIGGIYRLKFNIPDHMILLSNFDTWHAVLNNMYLAKNVDDFHKTWTKSEIEESWQSIFNTSDVSLNSCFGPNMMTIQGTVWEVTENMLMEVKHFSHLKPNKNIKFII